jgi:autotransporter-associated beta strand protein
MGVGLAAPAFAQTIAHDDASDAAYNGLTWFNGQASGTGFSNWSLGLSGSTSAGVASSSDNDSGEPSNANINSGGRALRLVASGGATADGLRTFTNGALQVGQVFTIWIDNGNIAPGAAVGFGLQNDAAANNRFELFFSGGASNYTISDGLGSSDSGIGFTRGGLRVAVQLESINSYRMNIVRNGAPTATFFSTRTLSGTAGTGIDKFRVFNFNAGSNQFDDAFFSNQYDVSDGFVWDGGGGVDSISRPENWVLEVPPISSLNMRMYFRGTTGLTPLFSAGTTLSKKIDFDAGAGAFVLNGQVGATVTLVDGITNSSSNLQTLNVRTQINSNVAPDFTTTLDTGSVPGGGLQTGSAAILDITDVTRTVHWTGANAGTIGAMITGSGMLRKTGVGLLHMSSGVTHDFTGTTAITGGTLRMDGTFISPGGLVAVGNGTPNSGVLAGSGVISRSLTINNGGAISPGSGVSGSASTISTFTLDAGTTTLEGGGAYVVEMNRRADPATPGGAGVEGVNWDKLSLPALTVNANSGNKFVIRVISLNASHQPGAIPDWDPDVSQTWRVATVSGAVTGFDTDDFEIDVTQFIAHNTVKSTFFLWRSGSDINLTYVPEPGAGLGILGACLLLGRRTRRIQVMSNRF